MMITNYKKNIKLFFKSNEKKKFLLNFFLSKFNSDTSKNATLLISSSTIAAVIPFVLYPIISRLFTPASFGLESLFINITGIAAVFATGRYESAILNPRSHKDAFHLAILCLLISISFSILLLLFIISFNSFFISDLTDHKLGVLIYLIPVGVFLTSINEVLSYWNNRNKLYRIMSLGKVCQNGSLSIFQLFFGLVKSINSGLIFSRLISLFIGFIVQGFAFMKELFINIKTISFLSLKIQAIKYKKFPQFLIFSFAMASVYNTLPIFLISKKYGLELLGQFSFAYTIISIPEAIISKSIGNIFRQKASQLYNLEGKFDILFIKTIKYSFLFAIIPYLILLIFAPQIFTIVFGQNWNLAGIFARILVVMGFLSFVITPIDFSCILVGNTKYDFLWQLSQLFFISLLCVISIFINFPISEFIALFVAIRSIHYLAQLYFNYQFSKGK